MGHLIIPLLNRLILSLGHTPTDHLAEVRVSQSAAMVVVRMAHTPLGHVTAPWK